MVKPIHSHNVDGTEYPLTIDNSCVGGGLSLSDEGVLGLDLAGSLSWEQVKSTSRSNNKFDYDVTIYACPTLKLALAVGSIKPQSSATVSSDITTGALIIPEHQVVLGYAYDSSNAKYGQKYVIDESGKLRALAITNRINYGNVSTTEYPLTTETPFSVLFPYKSLA